MIPLNSCIYSHIIFYDKASIGSSKLTFFYHIRLINCYAAGLQTILGERNLSLTKPKDLVVQQFVHWIPQNLLLLLLQVVHIYVCVCVCCQACVGAHSFVAASLKIPLLLANFPCACLLVKLMYSQKGSLVGRQVGRTHCRQ